MKITDTDISVEELLDQMPMDIQYIDEAGYLRYLNRVAAAKTANCRREVGVNIQNCHAEPESLEMIGRIFEDFRKGRKEPHFYVTSKGRLAMKVPIFDAEDKFIGVLAYSHPVGPPKPDRTF